METECISKKKKKKKKYSENFSTTFSPQFSSTDDNATISLYSSV